jgi:murein DD-endopeptidase MepM/ murein hydrolase activator NlpD
VCAEQRGRRIGAASSPARVTGASAASMAALAVCALLVATAAAAQTVYQYRDENGVVVYTDRHPADGQTFEERSFTPTLERPQVHLLHRDAPNGTELVARNTYHAPVQLTWRLTDMRNLRGDSPQVGERIVPPRSDADLMLLTRADPAEPMSFEFEFEYLLGSPDAVHEPAEPYRLPYALASGFTVSQAYPDTITHTDPASQHAVDFAMPIGTGVYAARDGVVVEVASDFYEAGLDPDQHGPRANIVRILHSDGTMSLYGHLNWNSIRVVPGQRVRRGEHLADSGNTGFSSGPHLHFVVQRNAGGRLVSTPIVFAVAGGGVIDARSGDRPVAY